MVKSQELVHGFSNSETEENKSLLANSLLIPSGNYIYYPKQLSKSEISTNQKKTIAEIIIPSSDLEDEARNDYTSDYANNFHKQQSTKNPQCPFQLHQSFFSTKDSYYNTNTSSINNNTKSKISIDQSMPMRSGINNSINSSHNVQFNQTLPLLDKGNTPNASMPNAFFSPTNMPMLDFNNAFSYNNSNPIIFDKKQNKKKSEDQNAYIINDQDILIGKDRRTTIMIQNIPSKYTCKELIAEFDQQFKNKYDLFYLPFDVSHI